MAHIAEFQRFSRELVRMRWTGTEDGELVDPSSLTVSMAVLLPGVPPDPSVTDRFRAATWDVDTSGVEIRYYSQVEIGPGSLIGTLSIGEHLVYGRLVDSPEVPVKYAGRIRITGP